MGAQLWYHEADGHSEPRRALKAIQGRLLIDHYDLSALLPQHLAWARESVSAAEAAGDEYGLLDLYREKVRLLEGLCARPIPRDPEDQIEILRQIHADSGEGIGNVLDVTDISDSRKFNVAERLSEDEMTRLVGTTRPTIARARLSVDPINGDLGRGECVCFPYYDEGHTTEPAGWYFVGNMID